MNALINKAARPKVKRIQNFAGCLFLAALVVYWISLICVYSAAHTLTLDSLVGESSIATQAITGILMITAWVLLYTISSHLASDIFSMCQIIIELFFTIALPLISFSDMESSDTQEFLFVICAIFSGFSVISWIVLFCNNKASGLKTFIIWLLPLPLMLNLCLYLDSILEIQGKDSAWLDWTSNVSVIYPIFFFFTPVMMVGYWMLCHSEAFQGNKDNKSVINVSHTNAAAVIYSVGLALAIAAFLFA